MIANLRACETPPHVGETTTTSPFGILRQAVAEVGREKASRSGSTGMSKKLLESASAQVRRITRSTPLGQEVRDESLRRNGLARLGLRS